MVGHSDCCQLVCNELEHVHWVRASFVSDTVVELECSHLDAVAHILLVAHGSSPNRGWRHPQVIEAREDFLLLF